MSTGVLERDQFLDLSGGFRGYFAGFGAFQVGLPYLLVRDLWEVVKFYFAVNQQLTAHSGDRGAPPRSAAMIVHGTEVRLGGSFE